MATYQLIVNSGSTSKKYALACQGRVLARAHLERTYAGGYQFVVTVDEREYIQEIAPELRKKASVIFLETCVRLKVLLSTDEVKTIAFRIVAPGTYFTQHRVLGLGMLERLRGVCALAPAHIRVTLEDIEEVAEGLPKRKLLGISDSAFHTTMPAVSRHYALDPEFAATYDVYRFGYHGLSAAGITYMLKRNNTLPKRLVVVHVGGGVSVTAVEEGKSVDTSMGFLPLTGVPMATRAGDLDAGALFGLLARTGESTEQLLRRLYHDSGLVQYANLGTGGFKDILIAAKVGNTQAAQALSKYSYHLRKELAAAVAVLGGVDTVVLTGTALVRSPRLRAHTIDGLSFLGIILDAQKNELCGSGEGRIEASDRVPIYVIQTREMEEMARVAIELNQ